MADQGEPSKPGMSFIELAGELANAPEWVVSRVHEQERRKVAAAKLRFEERPLIGALNQLGIDVKSIWNLGDDVRGREDVAEVLLNDLTTRSYSDLLRGRVAQAVAATRVQAAWPRLAALYERRPGGQEAVGLAAALAACTPASHLDAMVALIRDDAYGSSRIMLLAPITRRLGSRGDSLLQELEHHPELGVEAHHLLHTRRLARARRVRNR